MLDESLEGVDRTAAIVRDVRVFSHGGSEAASASSRTSSLERALRVAEPHVRRRARVERDYGDVPAVEGSRRELEQVLLNLLINAAQAIEGEGVVRVSTALRGDEVEIAVSDTGCGIPGELIERIFDPFFTTKPVGEGTGLGLSISHEIVRRHGGRILVDSDVGRGTEVRVRLTSPARVGDAAPGAGARSRPGGPIASRAMSGRLRTITPIDGSVYVERPLADARRDRRGWSSARARAQAEWRRVPLAERAALLARGVDAFVARRDEIALEITWQMGRPAARRAGRGARLRGARARTCWRSRRRRSPTSTLPEKPGFTRFIRREPLGLVLTHRALELPVPDGGELGRAGPRGRQRRDPAPLRPDAALRRALRRGLRARRGCRPASSSSCTPTTRDVEWMVRELPVDHVAFTGSVEGGHAVQRAAAALRFPSLGLELGGKDPAYVRPDADLGARRRRPRRRRLLQRRPVLLRHRAHLRPRGRVRALRRGASSRRRGPTGSATRATRARRLGPMVRAGAAEFVRGQVAEAIAAGAKRAARPRGASPRTRRARPTWRRRCSSTSTTRCAS